MCRRQKILFVLAFLLIILTTACQPIHVSPIQQNEIVLSFENIELRQPVSNEKTWTDYTPGLIVITTPADIDAASHYISDEAIITLQQLDFAHHFALLAFDGWKSEGYQDFQIQKVVRQDAQVLIVAQPSYKSGDGATGVETSLYHLIKISKDEHWDQMITFKLYFDYIQNTIVTIDHYVP